MTILYFAGRGHFGRRGLMIYANYISYLPLMMFKVFPIISL